MPTIREVAQKAGVSVTTVSHVVNQTRVVAEDTQKRVKQVMQELGYRPNVLARSLRRGETHTLGLVLPDSANSFFAEMAYAIENCAFERNYSLVLCNTSADPQKERLYSEVLFNKQVDGIIFVAAGDDTQSLQELLAHNLPVVVVDRHLENIPVDTVTSDNFQGGYLAAHHLIDLGQRDIAIIRGPSNISPSAARVTSSLQTFGEAGISIPAEWIVYGDFHAKSGYLAMQQLLSLPKKPGAVFACNDLMAIGAMRAIYEAGLRIPKDISLIGFDNIELAAYTYPPLTTIGQPIQQLAEIAISTLLQRIQTPESVCQRITLPNELIIRQSTRRIV